jgi:hypothetical protein
MVEHWQPECYWINAQANILQSLAASSADLFKNVSLGKSPVN